MGNDQNSWNLFLHLHCFHRNLLSHACLVSSNIYLYSFQRFFQEFLVCKHDNACRRLCKISRTVHCNSLHIEYSIRRSKQSLPELWDWHEGPTATIYLFCRVMCRLLATLLSCAEKIRMERCVHGILGCVTCLSGGKSNALLDDWIGLIWKLLVSCFGSTSIDFRFDQIRCYSKVFEFL